MIANLKHVDSKEWTAIAAATLPDTPPYPDDLRVTSLSRYADDFWEYPAGDLPPGSRLKRFLRFYNHIYIPGSASKPRLQKADSMLVTQLKECTVAAIFRQSVLVHKRKVIVPKPASVLDFFKHARRIVISVRMAGYGSLSDLPSSFPASAFSEITTSDSEYNRLLEVFSAILTFAEAGLISTSLPRQNFGMTRRAKIEDTSQATGVQALSDQDLATALSASRFYIDNYEKLILPILERRHSGESSDQIAKSLNDILPLKERLHPTEVVTVALSLVKIAGYNFLGWHLGARISEILSARRGVVSSTAAGALLSIDRVDLTLQSRKSISAIHGSVRTFAVHPYLTRVCHVLEKVADFQGSRTSSLFEAPRTGEVIETNGFNVLLKRFARLHGYRDDISSHVWRNTLVSVTVRSVAEPLGPLAHLLGHKHISTVVGYAFSNPFIRKEMRLALAGKMSTSVDRFLDGSRSFGGVGLRGQQGDAIEKNLGDLASDGEHLREGRREIATQLAVGTISFAVVDEGIHCLKPASAKGLCARGKGDVLADTEHCHVDCSFRAETEAARDRLHADIRTIPTNFIEPTTSTLMKVRLASEITQRLKAWPELKSALLEILSSNPSLWPFFEEITNG